MMDCKEHNLQVQQITLLFVKLIKVKIKPEANHLQDFIVDEILNNLILIGKFFDVFEDNL